MITVDLRSPHLLEDVKILQLLKELGFYTDEELQALYDGQISKDKQQEG